MFLDEHFKLVGGTSFGADAYNTNPATDVVSMKNYGAATFIIAQTTGGTNTGTATITVEACSTIAAAATQTIPFYYRKVAFGAAASDTMGARSVAAAAGFATTANENSAYLVHVPAASLPEGFPFLRLKTTELVNDPVLGGVLIFLSDARFNGYNLPTAIA